MNVRSMGPLQQAMTDPWQRKYAMTVFLVLLTISMFAVPPMSEYKIIGQVVVHLLLSVMMLSGIFSLSTSRWVFWLAAGIAFVTAALSWAAFYTEDRSVQTAAVFAGAVYAGGMAIVLLMRVFGPGRVDSQRLQGAVAVYMLIGLTFAMLFEFAEMMEPGALRLPEGVTFGQMRSHLIYFSVCTLTTVGYGDVTALVPITRSLAGLEAVLGQVYLAILVGRLVALSLAEDIEDERRKP